VIQLVPLTPTALSTPSGPKQQFALLYPAQGAKGPNRIATVLSKQTLTQQALAKTLGLDQLHLPNVGNTGYPV
jgi:hypothetical protein